VSVTLKTVLGPVLQVAYMGTAIRFVRLYVRDAKTLVAYAIDIWPTNYAIRPGDDVSQSGASVMWMPAGIRTRVVSLPAVTDPKPITESRLQ
jgi:hypothetical protein